MASNLLHARAAEETLKIDGKPVRFTRLDKILYPGARYRKADVVDYYLRVAPFLLPHLKDRPITLKRYPNGIHGDAYWDKDTPSFAPDWVRTFPVPRHAGGPPINYILIDGVATLAWTANTAALELHPFLHKIPEINVPTSVVFDLDPGAGADLRTCVTVANALRGLFERLGLRSFPKVSGSKGMQVYVPLNTPTTYEVTQAFALTVARLVEHEQPELAVSDMAKEKRAGKVFIDWSQNSDFKTTVGVYSLRAKRDRPYVSLPVTWDELDSLRESKNPDQLCLEPEAALKRLERVGDLFAPLLTLKQTLPPEIVQVIKQQRQPQSAKSLTKYAAKRDFAKTSEPAPSVPRRSSQGGKRRFVIQKHAASHLHYDFRLEMHGVLKSWAVPKGPPNESGVRRLATATEDHPLEYIDFEGIIPQGQYGGGTVMVWDIGTYEIIEGNYYQGLLHIALSGKKLKGEWRLTRDRAKGQTAWLLEKVDAPAKTFSLTDEDKSALTKRTMAEIAEAKTAVWHSNRAPIKEPAQDATTDPLPHGIASLPASSAAFVEPMQCKLVHRLPEGDEWEYEAKFDGYRALAIKSGRIRLISRNNRDLTPEYPAITAALDNMPEDTVLDGELIAVDDQGRASFNLLQHRAQSQSSIHYYVFDLLTYCGRSLLSLPLSERRGLLNTALANVGDPVRLSETLHAAPEALIAAVRQLNLEGIVAKRVASRYEPGKRTGSWVKYKVNLDQELVVGGYLPAAKRNFDALLVGYYSHERLIFCGKIRNGFGAPGAKESVYKRFKGLGTNTCPFDNLPEPRNARRGMALTAEVMELCCWLKPRLVAQVAIREWTTDGHLRHASFIGLREDKDARTVRKES